MMASFVDNWNGIVFQLLQLRQPPANLSDECRLGLTCSNVLISFMYDSLGQDGCSCRSATCDIIGLEAT